jgi:hypothetical protein
VTPADVHRRALDRLAELRAMDVAATSGPWTFNAADDLHTDAAGWIGHDRTGDGFQEYVCATADHPDGLRDGALIATVRNAWPLVLDGIEVRLQIHRPMERGWCRACALRWPCPTAARRDLALLGIDPEEES